MRSANRTSNNAYTKSIRNAIIRANKAIASVRAKPRMANLNKSSFNVGFLDTPSIKAANIKPIPIPAPARPNVDIPAPIFCEACSNNSLYASTTSATKCK